MRCRACQHPLRGRRIAIGICIVCEMNEARAELAAVTDVDFLLGRIEMYQRGLARVSRDNWRVLQKYRNQKILNLKLLNELHEVRNGNKTK